MALVMKEELSGEGWVYASDCMLVCELRSDLWEAWQAYASHIDWHQTTSSRLGGRFKAFLCAILEVEGGNFDELLRRRREQLASANKETCSG